jgi:hypothetical protein
MHHKAKVNIMAGLANDSSKRLSVKFWLLNEKKFGRKYPTPIFALPTKMGA